MQSNRQTMVCSICYSEVIKNPKKLNCGHLFCNKCITEWLKVSPGHDCPECRTVIEIPVRPVPHAFVLSIPELVVRIRPVEVLRINYPTINIADYCLYATVKSLKCLYYTLCWALVLALFCCIGWLFIPTGFNSNNSSPELRTLADICIYILIGAGTSLFLLIVAELCCSARE